MTHASRQHEGTIYLPLLATTMLVGMIALAAVKLARVQGRAAKQESDWAIAQLQAHNAIEGGLFIIDSPNWRDMPGAGTGTLGFQIGPNMAMLEMVDPVDGDIGDSPEDDVVLTATGTMGDARHKTQVTVEAVVQPLEALTTCLHAAGDIEVKGGAYIAAQGAPISTDGNIDIDEMVIGDVSALTRTGGGTITGTTTLGAEPKDLPDAQIIDDYIGKATAIYDPGDRINWFVLSPDRNPWGAANADCVYYIDTNGHDLTIKHARIWGTLVIRTGGKKVTIKDAVFMEPFRSDYPLLIVDGDLKIQTNALNMSLDEDGTINFNPSGTPYEGHSDNDRSDTYPNEIRGLIHVTGEFEVDNSPVINGVVIGEGAVTCHSSNTTFIYDESLPENPPEGYGSIQMQIKPGSWRQIVD